MGRHIEGTVVRLAARLCHVEVEGGVHAVALRGRLFEERGHEKQPLAAGDRVRVFLSPDGGAVEERLPRRNVLSRSAAGHGGREQVLAANVDQVLVVVSFRQPPPSPDLVDRILAGAERQEIPAAVVLNKADLAAAGEGEELVRLYGALGYPVLRTSAVTGQGVQDLRPLLQGRLSVLAGPSGAGKSSLLNAVDPSLDLRVGAVSERSRLGRHTTTAASLHRLSGGGLAVDTPGIRGFGLFRAEAPEVARCFREIARVAPGCRFHDCLHRVEDGCAVRRAVEEDRIAPSRHGSYLALLREVQALRRRQP